ncbi:RNA polymerase sigma-70 factor (ECF subfamily) [Methylopila capsulata]|uniref:DNA-directed RNA polymerase sigma-70 factor n=1 Tax=Methylopila capsulata TaxID=61654 RepID=A0A9W6IPU8_9HYPH|nr:sigma-70 family RNA polymerase sigma factor [Methylopila capsulata]MBM7851198.1 RNA polymerase sigma-70 factor (ECF subfamily) [Methylopila capsulata]GLK54256.1 DNA-directed RNA polymerase sigma-70 factor [Methylopila capsulata]
MGRSEEHVSLFLAHRAALVDYATPIVGSRDGAEDVVQEAFFRAQAAAAAQSPLSYLHRIVRNLALDVLRRRKLEAVHQSEHEAPFWTRPQSIRTPEQQSVFDDEARKAQRALAELPEQTRVAVEMHRFGGHRLEEVAARLGVSIATAHRLVRAGLTHVARRMAEGD